MKLSLLFEDKFKVAGVTNGEVCIPVELLENLEDYYHPCRTGLYNLLEHVSSNGLQGLSKKLLKQVDAKEKIYEFRKGRLRLFFFKGHDDLLVICTTVIIKKTQLVDPVEVGKAIAFKRAYELAVNNSTLEISESELSDED